MCNLHSVRTGRAALARKLALSDYRMVAVDALPAIFPGHMAPIVKQSANGERELVSRSWGFVLPTHRIRSTAAVPRTLKDGGVTVCARSRRNSR